MLRSNKVILVSHCVLNQNSVVKPLAREKGGFSELLKILADYPVGLIQLPCPETLMLGLNRPPMTKEEYDTRDYRELCSSIAEKQSEYVRILFEGGCCPVGIIGIEDSPTCSLSGKQGVFAEELLKQPLIGELPRIDVPSDYHENIEIDESFHMQVRELLETVFS